MHFRFTLVDPYKTLYSGTNTVFNWSVFLTSPPLIPVSQTPSWQECLLTFKLGVSTAMKTEAQYISIATTDISQYRLRFGSSLLYKTMFHLNCLTAQLSYEGRAALEGAKDITVHCCTVLKCINWYLRWNYAQKKV
jgi:hypothetical protein